MSSLERFNGLDSFLKSMSYFIDRPQYSKPKKFTYWRYDERSKKLKDINRESMVQKLGENTVHEMEKEAFVNSSDNCMGFIVQYQ